MEPAPHATASAVPSQDETHFRRHFNRTFAQDNGATYESYRPAYRYGYAVGSDEGSNGREWDSVESEVRRDWERQHQGTWEQFQVAIRSAVLSGAMPLGGSLSTAQKNTIACWIDHGAVSD